MSASSFKSQSKVFFPNLDGLRFMAFMAVYIQHSFEPWANHYHFFRHFYDRVPNFLVHLGGEGVSCFFVLSGFLITYLLLKETEQDGQVNVLHFYMRRALRIWPIYYLLVILNFSVFHWFCNWISWPFRHWNPLYVSTFLTNFNFIQLLRDHDAGGKSLLGATWSVTVEEQFYLVWPLLFFIFPKKLYKYIFLGILIISYAFRIVYRFDGANLYFNTLSVCGDLAVGGLCGYFSFYSTTFKNFISHLGKRQIIAGYLVGLAYLYYSLQVHHSNNYIAILLRLGSCLFYAFIIVEQNFANHSFYKFSNARFMSKWGKYTYGLYMYHLIVITFLTASVEAFFPALNQNNLFINILLSALYLAVSFFISYISYEYFEKRFIKLKDKFATVKTRPVTQ